MTDEHPDLPAHDVQHRPSFWHWIVEGLRASVLLAPRIAASPSPWQLMLIVLIPLLLVLGIERFQIDGPATFHPAAELNAWWAIALTLWVGWAALPPVCSSWNWEAR